MSDPIKVGDVVALKSGSVAMTVVRLKCDPESVSLDNDFAELLWFCESAGEFRREMIKQMHLTHVKTP